MDTLLRKTRKKQSLTLAQAASLLGTTSGNLSRIETGLQHPSIPLARRIAAEYRLTLDQIYAGEDTDIGKRRSFHVRRYTPQTQPAKYGLYVDIDSEMKA